MNQFTIRNATLADREQIEELIQLSARKLSVGYYNKEEIEAAIASVFGVDTRLIEDGTYFIAEIPGDICGCGGWSKRKTLFGGDQFAKRDAALLDPDSEPAKIRAFFIHPDFARKGIGRAILARCETEARRTGFRASELMSTLPGVEFYERCGYVAGTPVSFQAEGVPLKFVPMRKSLFEKQPRSMD